jgi:hypothetical protein
MSLSAPPDAATYVACKQIIERSAYLSDIRDFTGYSELFLESGQLTRPGGQPLVGRAAIVASYQTRPADRMTRHMVGHSIMEVLGEGRVRAITIALLWSTNTGLPVEAFGRKADARQSFGEYDDILVQTPAGWRIEKRDASFAMYRD